VSATRPKPLPREFALQGAHSGLAPWHVSELRAAHDFIARCWGLQRRELIASHKAGWLLLASQ